VGWSYQVLSMLKKKQSCQCLKKQILTCPEFSSSDLYILGYKGIWGAVTQCKSTPDFFPQTTRNTKILVFHHIAIIFLRKLHRNIFNDLLPLPSLLGFLSIVVVKV